MSPHSLATLAVISGVTALLCRASRGLLVAALAALLAGRLTGAAHLELAHLPIVAGVWTWLVPGVCVGLLALRGPAVAWLRRRLKPIWSPGLLAGVAPRGAMYAGVPAVPRLRAPLLAGWSDRGPPAVR